VLVVEPRVRVNTLGLEPNDGLHAALVRVVADGAQSSWEPPRVDLPRAGLRPAHAIARVPARVHPPVADGDALLEVAVDALDLVLFVGVHHLVEEVRAAAEQLRLRQPSHGSRDVVGQHPSAPDVLGADPVAMPELESDKRRADGLPRVQHEMSQLLPGPRAQPHIAIARPLRGPLARPAHGDDESLAHGGLQTEVGHIAVRRSSAGRTDARHAAGRK